jgi:hypothetical protein
MSGLVLSTIIEIDSEGAQDSTVGDTACNPDGSLVDDAPADRQRRKRQALSADVESAMQSGSDKGSSGWSRPISIADRPADLFESIDVLLKQATSAVMAHRLRHALKAARLQHVWVAPGAARVAVPSAGAFSVKPIVLRVLPNMHWQCQMDLPAPAEHLKVNCNSSGCGVACDGTKVYFRYGAACSMVHLCSDITRVAHMAELCYSLAESAELELQNSSIRVRCASLKQVVIECLDKAKTVIIVDANLSSTQSSRSNSWPELRVAIEPRLDCRRLHFCAKSFFPGMYRVVGCGGPAQGRAAADTAGDGSDSGGRCDGMVDIADVRACARYLIEEENKQ